MVNLSVPLRFAVVVLVVGMTACSERIPRAALQLSQESVQDRQMQSRHFQTADENAMLAASAALLQDLGFNLDESEPELGVLVASKRRDAREVGQMLGAVMRTILSGRSQTYDEEQEIRASLVTRPSPEGTRIAVRITFQRTVWDSEGEISKTEAVNEPQIYQQFFDKLSKSVFLEAQLS